MEDPSHGYSDFDVSDDVTTPTQHGVPRQTLSREKESAYSSVSSDPPPDQKSNPSSNSKTYQTPGKIYWRPLTIAICLYLVGITMAIGHHEFLQSLNNKQVHDQVWINRGSLIMAFVVKTGLAGAIGFAFVQTLWHTLQRVPRGVSLSALDSLFSAVESPLVFLSWDAWRSALLPMLMIVPLWLMPVISIVSPTSLTIGALNQSTADTNCVVPFLNMSLENDVTSENSGDLLSVFTAENGYGGTSFGAQRLVNTVAQTGQQIGWSSPCGTNCTYELQFNASSWKCSPSADMIDPPEAPWETTFIKDGTTNNETRTCQNGYDSFWFPGCGNGSNITVQQLETIADGGIEYSPVYAAGLNDTTSRLWVGITRSSDSTSSSNPNTTTVQELLDVNVFYCEIMNTGYKIQVNYINSEQSVNILELNQFSPIEFSAALSGGNTDTVNDEIFGTWSLYHYMVSLFSGNLNNDPEYGISGETSIALVPTLVTYNESNAQDPYLPIYDMAPLLEDLSRNVSISLLSNSKLRVTNETTTTCTKIETIAVWKVRLNFLLILLCLKRRESNLLFSSPLFKTSSILPKRSNADSESEQYKPEPLIIAYVSGVAVTTLVLIASLFSVWSSRSVKDTKFSTILQATRGEHLDRLVAGEPTVALPLSKRLQNARLCFSHSNTGGFTVDGQEREMFQVLE